MNVNENNEQSLYDIALTKAYAYAESGENKKLAKEGIIVEAYTAGFLAGIAYQFTGDVSE